MIVKLLRTIKTTEDATADPQTERIYIMCDLGLSVARTLLEGHFKENTPEVVKFPGGCPLPVSLFASQAGKRTGTDNFKGSDDEYCLPELNQPDFESS